MSTDLRLTRFAGNPDSLPPTLRHAWPLVVDCQGTDIPSEIFVYHAGSSGDPLSGDKFECVASVSQLYDLPKDTPLLVGTQSTPYYRSRRIELVLRSATEAERVWTILQAEAQNLVNNWNSVQDLQATETTRVTSEVVTAESIDMKPPAILTLAWQPAGTATYVSGVQGITAPDPTIKGWLPVSSVPSGWNVPPGAVLFYNINKDAALQANWPPREPFSGNMLYRNGIFLLQNVVYIINSRTIWWMGFDNTTMPNFTLQSGNMPWDTDYISPTSPGSIAPQIQLVLYR